jgi:uncharacterized Zn finger protein (UPF0148 family)
MKNRKFNKLIDYHCPRCKSYKVWELDNYIHCPECALTFNKNLLNKFIDSEILSHEELKDITNVLNEKIEF